MSKTSRMHHFKKSMQNDGWGEDYNIFEKLKFYNFYKENYNNIPIDKKEFSDYFNQNLLSFINGNRNSKSVFTTKFMDKNTEDNLPYDLSIKKIEEGFDRLIYFKENPQLKYGKINVQDAINYFCMQKSRNPMLLSDSFLLFVEQNKDRNNVFQLSKDHALKFRNFYNQQFKLAFSQIHEHYKEYHNTIQVINTEVDFVDINPKYYINGEIHTINLIDFNNLIGKLLKYDDKFLATIDVSIIQGRRFYFLIINSNYPPEYYSDLIKDVIHFWNGFSFGTSFKEFICPSTKDFKEFLKEQIYISHINNGINKFYNDFGHIEKLLYLESLIDS